MMTRGSWLKARNGPSPAASPMRYHLIWVRSSSEAVLRKARANSTSAATPMMTT